MIRPITDSRTEQIALLFKSGFLWKFIIFFVGMNFLPLLILGFAFQIMAFGLCLILLRLAFIYDPAYQLLVRLLNLKGAPQHLIRVQTWYMIFSSIMMLFPLVIALTGIWLLFHAGFCSQNIACLLLFASKR